MSYISVNVGQHMRRWRSREERPQQFLARRVNDHGFTWTQSVVSDIECGRRRVTVDELVALAAVFDIPPAMLLEPVNGTRP